VIEYEIPPQFGMVEPDDVVPLIVCVWLVVPPKDPPYVVVPKGNLSLKSVITCQPAGGGPSNITIVPAGTIEHWDIRTRTIVITL